jgi:hypothetical protein
VVGQEDMIIEVAASLAATHAQAAG